MNTQTTFAWRDLALLCSTVFAEFLALGVPLPLLPTRVHDDLSLGALAVGLGIGAQSVATLLTRHRAGVQSDTHGTRRTLLRGLLVSTVASLIIAASGLISAAQLSFGVLISGRLLLGLGESLVVTSALAWGVGLAGRQRTGLVMAWVGIAMYGALALGAPLGASLSSFGFAVVGLVAALAPLAGAVAAFALRDTPAVGGERAPMRSVLGQLWLPGLGLSLSAVGFGAIVAFSALLFAERGWSASAALAMTAFGGAYVLARVLFGSLPDRLGGARVAVASTLGVTAGQLGLWLAPSPGVAIAAAAITGLGFSLAFPSFGVEAMKRVPPASRGVALGTYAACFDATMGLGVPLLGVVVGLGGAPAAFGAGALAGLASLALAATLLVRTGAVVAPGAS
jgi:MFS family permease